MSFVLANRGLFTAITTAMTSSTDLRQAVFTGTPPSDAAIKDMNTLADVIADASSAESVASGYARADLSGVAVTEDDSGDRVLIVANAPVYSNVAAGETWTFTALYVEGASDAARALIGIDKPASSQVTFGGDITGPATSISIAGA